MRRKGWPSRRTYATYLGGTRIKFTWECGATEIKDYSKGPRTKRMSESACQMMARWWSKEKGGATAPCPKGPGCPNHETYQEELRTRWWYSTVMRHIEAERACGRRWTKRSGCACGACRAAKDASFIPPNPQQS